MNRRSSFYVGIPAIAIVAFVILFITSPDPEFQPSPIHDVKFGGASVETAKVIGGDTLSIPIEIESNDEKTFTNVRVFSVVEQNEIRNYITIPEFVEVGTLEPNQKADISIQVETNPVDSTTVLDLDLQILADEVVTDEKQILVTITPEEVP